MIIIVDYDAGNIGSIRNMLKKIGHESALSSNPADILAADKLILPGVGAFDYGMNKLTELGLMDALNRKKNEGTPILGICLGAQIMCKSSEEGELPGLGWIDAEVHRFPAMKGDRKLLVPHMGWDFVASNKPSTLFDSLPSDARFYFVHSYFIRCSHTSDKLASNLYGAHFDSAFERGNILGVQFHPEKSHKFGRQLLKNFIEKY